MLILTGSGPIIAGAVVGAIGSRTIHVQRIDKHDIWLKKLPPAFYDHLPQLPTANGSKPSNTGLRVPRHFTRPGVDPLDEVMWDKRRTVIANPDGSVVFKMDAVEVPADWSQLATDIVVSKYFRKAGLPTAPGHETSVRQVVHRLARVARIAGEQQGGYFASPDDAEAFEAELAYMLVHQIGAFNSPVWFNFGLFHEYGISTGPGGSYYTDPATDEIKMTTDS